MLTPNRFAAALLATAAVAVSAAKPATARYDLKDGSMLYVRPDGTMNMVDARGKAMSMKDGVEMELKDGNMLMISPRSEGAAPVS